MNDKPPASTSQGQPGPEGLPWTNLWIEEAENLNLAPATQAVAEASEADTLSPLRADACTVWIEEEEDLGVRPLCPSTVTQEGVPLTSRATDGFGSCPPAPDSDPSAPHDDSASVGEDN